MEPSASAQISIHALREEGDLWLCLTQHTPMTFLSTPSARRATKQSCKEYTTTSNFYPRPPRGGRHHRTKLTHMDKKISIHALREEGDVGINGVSSTSPIFLSTPSARRATILWDDFKRFMGISIHALREEGDYCFRCLSPDSEKFLSTPSARRATVLLSALHIPLLYFYPRPPRGGRRAGRSGSAGESQISIHALREEGDQETGRRSPGLVGFLSTPSARRATRQLSQ